MDDDREVPGELGAYPGDEGRSSLLVSEGSGEPQREDSIGEDGDRSSHWVSASTITGSGVWVAVIIQNIAVNMCSMSKCIQAQILG